MCSDLSNLTLDGLVMWFWGRGVGWGNSLRLEPDTPDSVNCFTSYISSVTPQTCHSGAVTTSNASWFRNESEVPPGT